MAKQDMAALKEQIAADRKELFNLKMNLMTGQVKDVSQFKKLRKKIARAYTQMNAPQQSASADVQDAS